MAANPITVQKKLQYAALAHQVIRARMAQGQTITYKELHDEIDSPWRWHGNEFSQMLAVITVVDRDAANAVVTKETGAPSLGQDAWNRSVDSFDEQLKALLSAE